jgi:hypothetical protein
VSLCWAGNMRAHTSLTRMICRLFVGFAIVCLVAAAVAFASVRDNGRTGNVLRFRSVHQSLGDVPAGVEIPVSFAVTNQCSRSVTLLGASQFCADWGCVYASRFPVTLAPHASKTFSMEVRTRDQSGEFAAEVILYSDAPGCGQIALSIAGKIVPVPKS